MNPRTNIKSAVEIVPSPVVAAHLKGLSPYLDMGDRNVLDAGCGWGRNSMAMFDRGYGHVLGIDSDPDAVAQAQERSNRRYAKIKKTGEKGCEFAEVDVREVSSLDEQFSVVMVNEVLHNFPKTEQYDILRDLQLKTKHRGLHLASGYLLSLEVQDSRNRERMLNRGELQRFYASTGWDIVRTFDTFQPVRTIKNREHVLSLTNVIARRVTQGL